MNIIIKDTSTGKEYLIKGADNQFEIFKRSKGEKRKGEWITARYYPTSLPHAVGFVMNLILTNPEDKHEWCFEAEKIRNNIVSKIDKRIKEIVAEVTDELD